jgi:multidrug resistance efflux pump
MLAACGQAPRPEITVSAAAGPKTAPSVRVIRASGLIRAKKWQSVRVPQLSGTGIRLTLTRLIPNGSRVSSGDTLVEFDRTSLLDEERENKAKLDDISHQVNEKRAQANSEAAKRLSQIREAEADLEKALLQLRKGPILSEIDRKKNQARAETAKLRLESLRKSDAARKLAEQASVKVLELKLDRQQVALERSRTNLDRLVIKAGQDGMIVLENTWRNGSMGPPQEGDQVWPGLPLMRIFDPTTMEVEAQVNEPDAASLTGNARARLYLDAYPGVVFDASLRFANPVATTGVDSPVRTFNAIFAISQQDPRLLPDLSAALEIDVEPLAGPHS